MNFYPMRYVVRAALDALDRWIRDGDRPATVMFDREYRGYLVEDDHGNVTGGVRSPVVDVPVATYDGRGDCDQNTVGGETTQFDPVTLAELYPTHDDYVDRFRAATASAVEAGWLLAADAELLVARADASPIGYWGGSSSGDENGYDRDLQQQFEQTVRKSWIDPTDSGALASRFDSVR